MVRFALLCLVGACTSTAAPAVREPVLDSDVEPDPTAPQVLIEARFIRMAPRDLESLAWTPLGPSARIAFPKHISLSLRLPVLIDHGPEVVSSPRITTLSGRAVRMRVGVKGEGGLAVAVLPRVATNCAIELRVAIGDELDTRIRVADGETAAIAGLSVRARDPRLRPSGVSHHVPVLRWLFADELAADERRELFMFLTPRIVKGCERRLAEQMALSIR